MTRLRDGSRECVPSRVLLLAASFTAIISAFSTATADLAQPGVVDGIPTYDGKRQVYALSEAPRAGVAIDLNIDGSHTWDFSGINKVREAFKEIAAGVPAEYKQVAGDAGFTLRTNIASRGPVARYLSHIFFRQDALSVKITGLASVQKLPFYGIKEVITSYDKPYDNWLIFPMRRGDSWTDTRTTRITLRNPGSKKETARFQCSQAVSRSVVDAGEVTLKMEPTRGPVTVVVLHERFDASCPGRSTVGHVYHWINNDLGVVASVAGLENDDNARFDRAEAIMALIRIDEVRARGLRGIRDFRKTHAASPK
jgi:hypothetical protein